MRTEGQRLRLADPVAADAVHVVVGPGRSTISSTRAGDATAICVLHGRVRVSLEHACRTLDAPDVLFLEGGEAVALGATACGCGPGNAPYLVGAYRDYGATTYHDVQFGYYLEALNTQFDVGVNKVGGKQPPPLYANNTLNANTDPSDFDLMGRHFWGRIAVKI